ncbi:AAA family ATPase [Vibrio gigantis]|uniref:AAA family ATPase n=1 Tax=Vibrio gigantis TaxID=296199 RepID=UPI001EFB8528|nr:AAA family ATPase [Vibrio gigantis]ULN66919.1 AAA family ATPase [Vibrio gigantis]
MKSIRVRNLRSFDNVRSQPFIDIKPITVFVGKNSCGKSSLLRSFPLLRQSIESNTSGPILWYGQYVDYGAFSQAKNKSNTEKSIFFDYQFDLKHQVRGLPIKLRENTIKLDLTLEVIESNKSTIAKSVSIKLNSTLIEVDFHPHNEVRVDGNVISTSLIDYSQKHCLIPSIQHHAFDEEDLFDFEEDEIDNSYNEDDDEDREEKTTDFLDILDELYTSQDALSRKNVNEIINTINNVTEGHYSYSDLEHSYLESMSIMSKEQIKYKINSNYELTRELTSLELEKIHKNNTICFTSELIDIINKYFRDYSRGIKYVAPLRATAERFYRFQDLRVEEIDHTGSNLAMLLRNLTKYEMQKFQTWCHENFGFVISVPETDNLHYEINVTIDGQTQNISDMGFGFSQILPIVTTLWLETSKPGHQLRNKKLTFVIEQPELHLHPEFQSVLARVFSTISNKSRRLRYLNIDINIIFETHSKTMIDAIGDYIEEHKCPELASIYIFDKHDGNTVISKSEFDEYGDLINWPIGFFSGR